MLQFTHVHYYSVCMCDLSLPNPPLFPSSTVPTSYKASVGTLSPTGSSPQCFSYLLKKMFSLLPLLLGLISKCFHCLALICFHSLTSYHFLPLLPTPLRPHPPFQLCRHTLCLMLCVLARLFWLPQKMVNNQGFESWAQVVPSAWNAFCAHISVLSCSDITLTYKILLTEFMICFLGFHGSFLLSKYLLHMVMSLFL